MLRKCTDEDISDEECEKVIDPFYENYDSYLEEYVVPEVIAFYIANSFSTISVDIHFLILWYNVYEVFIWRIYIRFYF